MRAWTQVRVLPILVAVGILSVWVGSVDAQVFAPKAKVTC